MPVDVDAALCFTRERGWHLLPAPALLAALDTHRRRPHWVPHPLVTYLLALQEGYTQEHAARVACRYPRRPMRTLNEALDQFAYHPATDVTAPKHAIVRDLFRELVMDLWDAIPDGPEKTLTIRKVQEAQMFANLAIALTSKADLSSTRSIAPQLPAQDAHLDDAGD